MNHVTSIAARRRMAIRQPRHALGRRSDGQLMALVRDGDDDAFEVLYERHAAGVLTFCRHMLGSPEEAEEAVQHAFVSVHLGILQANGGEVSFKPWVYTIARNRCASVLRERRALALEPSAGPSTAGLRREVAERDDLRALVADVERLPEEQRAAFVLVELRELSFDEVAKVLGRNPSAVKGLVFRARSTMIERREARRVDCLDVRASFETAGRDDLARGPLRYHLDICPDCSAYLASLRRQRRLLGLALPVAPAVALRESVMASVGGGGAGAGVGAGVGAGAGAGVGAGAGAGGGVVAGGAATTGASLAGSGVLAKVAIVGALAGGTGVAAEAVREVGVRGGGEAVAVEPWTEENARSLDGRPDVAVPRYPRGGDGVARPKTDRDGTATGGSTPSASGAPSAAPAPPAPAPAPTTTGHQDPTAPPTGDQSPAPGIDLEIVETLPLEEEEQQPADDPATDTPAPSLPVAPDLPLPSIPEPSVPPVELPEADEAGNLELPGPLEGPPPAPPDPPVPGEAALPA